MSPFLVYNDEDGSFINVEDIQGCIATDGGSDILLRNSPVTVTTTLSPREVIRRANILRYKMGLDDAYNQASRSANTDPASRK